MKSTHGNDGNNKSYSMCIVSGEEIERLTIHLIRNDKKRKTSSDIKSSSRVVPEKKRGGGVNKDELRTSWEKDKRNVSFQVEKGWGKIRNLGVCFFRLDKTRWPTT